MKKFIFISMIAAFCLTACETEFVRVFKQHLYSQLTETQTFMDKAVEGTEEGQYKIGSKAILKEAIDKGYSIYWDSQAGQETVDDYCTQITEALATFKLSMNPSFDNLRSLLVQASELIEIAKQNGISQEQIDSLNVLVNSIQTTLNNPGRDLTQKDVDGWEQDLTKQISGIEDQITVPMNVHIDNPSFEPLNSTEQVIADFSLVPGWTNAGYVNGVTPWGGLLSNAIISKDYWMLTGKSVDKNYALYVQTYSKQVWQKLAEKVRENCTYTVTAHVTRDQWKDAEKTKFQIQLISFEGRQGDFENVTVLAEQEFANISKDDFQECKIKYSTLANNVGKQITVCLRSYYNTPANSSGELAWKDVGVSVDNINITREKNK